MDFSATLSLLGQATIIDLWVMPLVQLFVGLGLVIFVHELGHFLVAKAVGIKVEKFSLGFGPKIIGFTRGETLYQIAALPLGGYVKMLGQEDFKPLQEGDKPDPRAYSSKPVWARLAVVSAGVVMNVIFAVVLFTVAVMSGINFSAPVVGGVASSMPAERTEIKWQSPIPDQRFVPITEDTFRSVPGTSTSVPVSQPSSTSTPATNLAIVTVLKAPSKTTKTTGLKPYDRIVSINGVPIVTFNKIFTNAALSGPDDKFTLEIDRTIDGKVYRGVTEVGVAKNPATGMLAFGVSTASSNIVEGDDKAKPKDGIESGDVLVAIDGNTITNGKDMADALAKTTFEPMQLTFQRDGKKVTHTFKPDIVGGQLLIDKKKVDDAVVLAKTDDNYYIQYRDGRGETVPAFRVSLLNPESGTLNILGMTPRIGVGGVNPKSPADKAGMEPGDVIVNYGDLGAAPTQKQLYEINDKYADKGTNIVLERDGKLLPAKWIVPNTDDKAKHALLGFVPVADMKHSIVGGIDTASPAYAAGLRAGDRITQINGQPVADWLDTLSRLGGLDGKEVVITYQRNAQEGQAAIAKLDLWTFNPLLYANAGVDLGANVGFKPLEVTVHKPDIAEALPWGITETWNSTLDTYVSIRRLFAQTISYTELRGPLGIGSAAVKVSRHSFMSFLYFMGIISVSLAVLNFLPIPVVDGGHAAFLIAEKIRGKPVSVKFMNFVQYIGLALLLGLFCVAMWNDIGRFLHGKW